MRFRMRRGFWSGYFVCLCAMNFVYDWRGLEGSIAAMRAGWINTPWWMWIPLGLIALVTGTKTKKPKVEE